jgi:Tol biopolymer transport system component
MEQRRGMRARRVFILLIAAGIAGACESSTEPLVAARIEAVTPINVTGVAGTEVTPAPTVRVIGAGGDPLPGVQLFFEFFGGSTGPDILGITGVVTGADGTASVPWRLGTAVGDCGVRARSAGLQDVVFTGTVQAGPVASLEPLGTGHRAVVGGRLPAPLAVLATDEFSNPVAGAAVTFSVISGGGTLEGASAVTNAYGVATSGSWTLGPVVGEQHVLATSGAAELQISAIALTLEECEINCPASGELAFVRDNQIFRVKTDGTGLQQLTSGSANAEPAWSPDGLRIAFVSDRHGGSDIYVMNADGSGIVRRTTTGRNYSPAWSPDGKRIAFSGVRDGDFGIYVMRVDEDWWNVAHVGFDRGWNAYPAWSPDGSRIAFISDWNAFDFVFDLYVVNADGSDVRLVLKGPLLWADGPSFYFQPAWSPDGSTIAVTVCAYAWDNCYPNSTIGLVNPDGSGFRTIADAGSFARPTWSPDGHTIAFAKSSCRTCASAIHYVTRDGSASGLLVSDGHSPAWRPHSQDQ